jgi:hypothetical protein
VQYLLGESDAQRTLAAAKAPGDQCEAQFYIGAALLARNARDEGLAYLRNAVEICPKNFIEYIRAAAQLTALGVEAPKALGVEAPKAETSSQPKAEPAPAPASTPKAEPGPILRLDASPEKADGTGGQAAPTAPQAVPQAAEPEKSAPSAQPKDEPAPQTAPATDSKPSDEKH